ncbi:agmatine deiminase family protein [Winogradskyella sp. 3972H.M.0a.05]|uniref:agmatine deiminase family protein n=1 Tax=Winogradskyella sp. 3972H.M.0a.05 TaxID=2950277 RepID=UPI00339A0FB9
MRTEKILLSSMFMLFLTSTTGCDKDSIEDSPTISPPDNAVAYRMPSEEAEHEGTWLQWPHRYTYGQQMPDRYDQIWIDMTKALHEGEIVHIIAYNNEEKNRITSLLENANVDMNQIDFLIEKTEDVWVRDNGPIFVFDENDNLKITNWQFNGWGEKADYFYDNQIPSHVSNAIGIPKIDVDMVLEGGAIEIDGNGTLMATRSSILNTNRNPGLTQEQAESFFKHYLGITNFVWLDGIAGQDITDYHIDGFARFVQGNILLTHAEEYMFSPNEFEVLSNATNADGELYTRVELPVAIQSQGSYMNYYVGNKVVLVPNYDESTDSQANAIIQGLYPDREVVGIIVNELWEDGGAIHCVTQQQPKN